MQNEEYLGWAVFAANPAIGAKTLHRLRALFENPSEAISATADDFQSGGFDAGIITQLKKQQAISAESVVAEFEKYGITFLWYDDDRFPARLRELPDPPACLYWRGAYFPDAATLAVVGSRKATNYGRQVAEELVADLARSGLVIVSGLAFGIDAIAHQATLDAGGATIAVLGNGLHDMFPSTHRALGWEIIAKDGAVISEFPPGTPPQKQNFPIRNRIIAGMSLGTLVVEAAEQSGSLITARAALDYNRDVFAVPGPITSFVSAGPHGLIRLGATLVTSAHDILTALNLEQLDEETEARAIVPDSPIEATLLPLLSRVPIQLDELIRSSELEAAVVSSALTLMEIKGRARNLGGNRYVIGR